MSKNIKPGRETRQTAAEQRCNVACRSWLVSSRGTTESIIAIGVFASNNSIENLMTAA